MDLTLISNTSLQTILLKNVDTYGKEEELTYLRSPQEGRRIRREEDPGFYVESRGNFVPI